jgi:hypothetical protein
MQIAMGQKVPGQSGRPFDPDVDNDRAQLLITLDAIDFWWTCVVDTFVVMMLLPFVATVSCISAVNIPRVGAKW